MTRAVPTFLRYAGAFLGVLGLLFCLLPLGDASFGQLLDSTSAVLTLVAGIAIFALGVALQRQAPK